MYLVQQYSTLSALNTALNTLSNVYEPILFSECKGYYTVIYRKINKQ